MTTGVWIVLGIIVLGLLIFGWFPFHWFSPGDTIAGLRTRMYLGLRRRGWTRRAALHYAIRNPRSFRTLHEAVHTRRSTIDREDRLT